MYYVIECRDVSPDALRTGDHTQDCCLIQTSPAETNSSHEPCERGWLGTTNDTSFIARGAYESMEAASARCARLGYGGAFGYRKYAGTELAPQELDIVRIIFWGPEDADSERYLGPRRDYDAPDVHEFLFGWASLTDSGIENPEDLSPADIRRHAKRLFGELTSEGYWGFTVGDVMGAITDEILATTEQNE